MVKRCWHDIFLAVIIGYSTVDLFYTWDAFQDCINPMPEWLLVSYLIVILFRVVHVFGLPDEDEYELWFFRLFTIKRKFVWFLLMFGLYPFYIFWTVQGTLWYAQIMRETPKCFKDPQLSWYIILWIILCYIWLTIYAALIAISIVIYFRSPNLNQELENLIEQHNTPSQFMNNQILQDELHGMSPRSITHLKMIDVGKEELGKYQCSIWQFKLGIMEKARKLPCNHYFHAECIDPWLLRQGSCPNCKRSFNS